MSSHQSSEHDDTTAEGTAAAEAAAASAIDATEAPTRRQQAEHRSLFDVDLDAKGRRFRRTVKEGEAATACAASDQAA